MQNIEPWTVSLFHLDNPSVHIWIESDEQKIGCAMPTRLSQESPVLQELYNNSSSVGDWVRFVELDINDERLLNSPMFQESISRFLTQAKSIPDQNSQGEVYYFDLPSDEVEASVSLD